MTEHDNYWQHDLAIGEARFWREAHTVRMMLHQESESHRESGQGERMEPIKCERAYYIKLGEHGKYAPLCMEKGVACIGFHEVSTELLNSKNPVAIRQALHSQHNYKTPGIETRDLDALMYFVSSTADDVWITFHDSKLWWGRFDALPVQENEDGEKPPRDRYRILVDGWHDRDINGAVLYANQIPGNVAKVQMFRGTICKVENKHDFKFDDLKRLINHEPSDAWRPISRAKQELAGEVQEGIKGLHWRDFETLVDLIFRNAGWRQRTSSVGGSMKYADIELEAPITGELYLVQVKEQATVKDFELYADQFPGGAFKKLYFVVGRPDKELLQYPNMMLGSAELILPPKIAEMIVDLGLTDWLLKKIR